MFEQFKKIYKKKEHSKKIILVFFDTLQNIKLASNLIIKKIIP